MSNKQTKYSLDDLRYLMKRLRNPESGCPWDLEQTYETIVASTIEEAYEVVDAIEQADYRALKEELGDLLFQTVFYCQLAEEESRFDLADVVSDLATKLIAWHPHVFPLGTLESSIDSEFDNSDQVLLQWEELKQKERENKGLKGLFDDVPLNFPALTRAVKIQKRAKRIGFDWQEITPVIGKLEEEIEELKLAIHSEVRDEIEMELGDILFTCVNVARHLKVDPETALRKSSAKFQGRLDAMAKLHDSLESLAELDPDQLEEAWEAAKL